MGLIRALRGLNNRLNPISTELLIEFSVFVIFLPMLIIMNKHNNLLFHSAVELFSCIIFFIIFVFAYNTYNINQNNFLMILGIGYFFVAIIDVFHVFSYPGVSILFANGNQEITIELWIIARYLGALTCLISTIFIFRPVKVFNVFLVFLLYFLITIFFMLIIFYFKVFPTCIYIGKGLSLFKIISEYIISFIYVAVAVIYFKLRKKIDFKLFICIECFVLLSVVSEMLFTNFIYPTEWTSVTGHILKAISTYFLFKGIVELGLKRPFSIIFNNLNAADTKVKEFEEIILNNEQCYNMIINNSDNAIAVVSCDKFLLVNKKMAELLGTDKVEDIIGLDISRVIPEETKSEAFRNINEAVNGRDTIPFTETKLLKFDGQVIDMEVTDCFCSYNGKQAALALFRDISARKQIKQLQNDIDENKNIIVRTRELNKSLTEFFANISHELKTPLNVILGAIQILALPEDNSLSSPYELKLQKYLKVMKQNCYRLLRLVNNLIDLSKFDTGYFKLNLKNHNIVNVIEDITQSVVDYVESKGIELIFDTDIEEKIMAVDVDKIERIILNLLSNSIKFTNEGGQILVSVFDKSESITISVKDTGVGIPQDKIDIIFDRFGQVDKTLLRNKEGSGIGLSLVKSIIDMHDGSIKVFSKLGEGSEFIIELPAKLVEEREIVDSRLYESKVEKISIEFSDIYS